MKIKWVLICTILLASLIAPFFSIFTTANDELSEKGLECVNSLRSFTSNSEISSYEKTIADETPSGWYTSTTTLLGTIYDALNAGNQTMSNMYNMLQMYIDAVMTADSDEGLNMEDFNSDEGVSQFESLFGDKYINENATNSETLLSSIKMAWNSGGTVNQGVDRVNIDTGTQTLSFKGISGYEAPALEVGMINGYTYVTKGSEGYHSALGFGIDFLEKFIYNAKTGAYSVTGLAKFIRGCYCFAFFGICALFTIRFFLNKAGK